MSNCGFSRGILTVIVITCLTGTASAVDPKEEIDLGFGGIDSVVLTSTQLELDGTVGLELAGLPLAVIFLDDRDLPTIPPASISDSREILKYHEHIRVSQIERGTMPSTIVFGGKQWYVRHAIVQKRDSRMIREALGDIPLDFEPYSLTEAGVSAQAWHRFLDDHSPDDRLSTIIPRSYLSPQAWADVHAGRTSLLIFGASGGYLWRVD
jgi:hypothetical protein